MSTSSDPLGLICPVCPCAPLVEGAVGLTCGTCRRSYPVVDGVPIVLRNADGWLRTEGINVLARRDLAPALQAHLARAIGGAYERDQRWRATYEGSREGPLQDWVRATAGDLDPPLLDLGCGLGWHGRWDAVGVDLDWTLLSGFPGRRVLADALEAPFRSDAFRSVLLVNVIDNCRDPAALLATADRLLAPGGTLLLTTPFSWQDDVTPQALRLGPDDLLGFFHARSYRVESQDLDWPLQTGPRTRVVHRTLALLARKSAGIASA